MGAVKQKTLENFRKCRGTQPYWLLAVSQQFNSTKVSSLLNNQLSTHSIPIKLNQLHELDVTPTKTNENNYERAHMNMVCKGVFVKAASNLN